jgi:hypothetical protein
MHPITESLERAFDRLDDFQAVQVRSSTAELEEATVDLENVEVESCTGLQVSTFPRSPESSIRMLHGSGMSFVGSAPGVNWSGRSMARPDGFSLQFLP